MEVSERWSCLVLWKEFVVELWWSGQCERTSIASLGAEMSNCYTDNTSYCVDVWLPQWLHAGVKRRQRPDSIIVTYITRFYPEKHLDTSDGPKCHEIGSFVHFSLHWCSTTALRSSLASRCIWFVSYKCPAGHRHRLFAILPASSCTSQQSHQIPSIKACHVAGARTWVFSVKVSTCRIIFPQRSRRQQSFCKALQNWLFCQAFGPGSEASPLG